MPAKEKRGSLIQIKNPPIINKKSRIQKTPLSKTYIIIILATFFILVLFIGNGFLNKTSSVKKVPTCGDRTFYDACSLTKPYICSDGYLIEKASVCGCPALLIKEGDSCVSKYQTSPNDIKLNYILRGEEKEIDFVVYEGMVNYLSDLSQAIYYDKGEIPSRADFKIKKIDEEEQRELLLPLVKKIQNITGDEEDQVRIAISVVQNIPFGFSEKKVNLGGGRTMNYSRYPYEVLYNIEGICGEKSELLAFLLRELGYGIAFFYNADENHESLGIECPIEQSLDNTGYCFIETTGPSILTDNSIEYIGGIKLTSKPEVIPISLGASLGENLYEYRDADVMKKLREGDFLLFKKLKLKKLREKYGLVDEYDPR